MKVLERASIKYKLWLPPIICLFGLLLLKVYTISRFRAELIERNIATIETTIFHHADEIRDSISQYVKDVNFLANTPPVEPFYEASISNDIDAYQKWRQRIIIILKSFMESRGEYLQISLLDRDGKEIISITSDFILGISIVPKKDLQDEKDMPYFLEAINAGNGQHYISDIILNKVLDKNNSYQRTVIQVAIPVYIPSSSKSSGVIAVSLDSRKTFGHLNQKSEPTTLYLLNSKRQYINRSDDEQRDYKDIREGDFQFIDNSNLKKLVQTDERSIGFYPEDKKVTGFEKIHFDEFRPERYWILYGAISEAIIFSRVNDLTALSFVLGLLITVFMSVLLFIITRGIMRSITDLVGVSGEIGNGNFERRVPFVRQDELGLLGSSINKMAENLSAIQALSDVLIVFDRKGCVLWVNRAAEEILEYSFEELETKHLTEFILGEGGGNDPFTDFEELLKLAADGKLKEISGYFVSKTEKFIPIILSGSLLHDVSGQLSGLIISVKDLRDSRLLNELREKQNELIQSAKLASLGEMSTGVAHELNNPLMLVSGFNSRIEKKLRSSYPESFKAVGENLREIHEASERMKKIIRHMKDFSRQSSKDFSKIKVNKVVEESFTLLFEQLRLSSINIIMDLSDLDPVILGDKLKLEQVFVNIISNSRDALSELVSDQPRRLEVRTEVKGKEVLITFQDNGPGIPLAVRERIFEPFFTTKDVGKGTGLGMSISYGIIKEHNGQISLSVEKVDGATFIIKLPLESVNNETKEAI